MSAVNIITEPDAIHMFCDGAHYLGDGTLGASDALTVGQIELLTQRLAQRIST